MTASRSRAQTEHARAYCARKRWLIIEDCIYVDEGISGAGFERRPALVRLLRAVDQKPLPHFKVLMMSGVGREQIETAPTDRLLASVGALADELERVKSQQRTTHMR